MITARFGSDAAGLLSAEISGHAGFAEHGQDIVCAAVTSCVEMAANTLTEVLHAPARAAVEGGRVRVTLESGCETSARQILEGLFLHLSLLAEQYPDHVQVRKFKVRGS